MQYINYVDYNNTGRIYELGAILTDFKINLITMLSKREFIKPARQ